MADRAEDYRPPIISSVKGNQTHFSSPIGDSYGRLRSKDRPDNCMKYRRFAVLHGQSIREWQQDFHTQKETRQDSPIHPQRADLERVNWLLTQIGGPLRPFNSAILNSGALKWVPTPNAGDYHSNGEYLVHGPEIFIHFDEILSDLWSSYEAAVEKLLRDPEAVEWLNSPLDPGVQFCHGRGGIRANQTTWLFKARRKLRWLVETSLLLVWISHITAALALPLIAHDSTRKGTSTSETNSRSEVILKAEVKSFLIWLLVYWYFSAVGIVLQGLQVKGLVYARKVFLGGILICFGGFYILYMLMGISARSSSAAILSLFTTVLLLIRTM